MKDNKEKVLKSLFERPGYHFHLRELAREVGIHPNTTSVVINSLHKEKVVIKEPYKGVVKIYCDLESVNFKRKKQLWNLARLYDSGLIDELILKYNHPKTIILFGSFGRGEDFSSSDIDLAIFSSEQKKLDLTKYEKKLSRTIHLISVENRKISGELYNNLINGFVIYGYLDNEKF